MDTLKNKSYKEYNSLSRYTNVPTYYDIVRQKYVYGVSSPLNTDTDYVEHKVAQQDTLESLAFKYYGRPDYYWIISLFNNVEDCFMPLYPKYKIIKIPVISNISFK